MDSKNMKKMESPFPLWRNIIMALMIIVFQIWHVNALESIDYPTALNECRTIVQQDSVAIAENISFILRPDGTTDTYTQPMSYKGNGYYNYSYCDTNISGTYIVNGAGDYPGSDWSYPFKVNPPGIDQNPQNTTAFSIATIAMFLISILFFICFIYFDHPTARISFGVMAAIFLLVGINLINNSLVNQVVDPSVISLFDFISAASYYFYWLGGGIILIVLFLTGLLSLQDAIKQKKKERYQ